VIGEQGECRRGAERGPPRTIVRRAAVEDVMSVIVEIRAAEGGDDAKLLVEEQFRIYARRAIRRCL
jgi:hypothetical protein